ncbi:MAG: aminotransferase class I/II-fold pyridoxal phosphate-dependent enzyme, partial [Solirubrobacterales bacterium]|nr:aminotransferase class I/II-fold pyridoxal phosphate-dependent enzyme [Solirubrobacterales bacterium]
MTALAEAHDAINLGQGFPDADGPDEVKDAAVAAIKGGHNQYAPLPGVPDLRAAIKAHQQRHYGYEPEDVMVSFGATEAIAAAVLGLCEPGDEVVVLEPYYDSYAAVIQFAGARRRVVTLAPPDFRLDPAELADAVSDRTRMILLNSPHNPT